MIVKKLSLTNFRRFRKFSMDFHPNLTVVVAENGQGKTAVLEAIAIALGTFVGAFDMGKARPIHPADARFERGKGRSESEQQFPVGIDASISIKTFDTTLNVIHDVGVDESAWDMLPVSRELTGLKNKTTIKNAEALTKHGRKLMRQVRDMKDVTLPVVSYYSSGRTWVAHKATQRKKIMSESRSMGYEDCLTSASSFKQLQQWMGKATAAVLQQEQEKGYEEYKTKEQVNAIKQAVNRVLAAEGWDDFHYNLARDELVMRHEHIGLLPVSSLSDGVRSVVALVADLAWRCTKLNPHLAQHAASETPGIALIDEVDLHLHPAWQQRVVPSLVEIFPRIQFIVTTHSPQVVSTVKKDSVRVIGFGDDDSAWSGKPMAMSYGEESQNVLQAIMGVDPQPPIPEKEKLNRLTALVDSGAYRSEEAERLMEELRGVLPSEHPQLTRLELSIECQEALKR